jgi:hypothetical protein
MNFIIQALVMIAISVLITTAMAPKPARREPEQFEDLDFPQVEDGTPQCVVFGDVWVKDWTILGLGNYRTTEMRA